MSFTGDLSRFVLKARGGVMQVQRKVALDLLTMVVERSPVDTGRFRGNHQVALGQANLSTDAAPDPDGGAVLSRGAAAVAAADGERAIVISNNLPYARALEHGHSQQAPVGVYAVSVAAFQALFAAAVARAKNGRGGA